MITISAIVRIAAEAFDVPEADIRYGGRSPLLVDARCAISYYVKQLRPDFSYRDIAQALGYTDHTSAMYTAKVFERKLSNRPFFFEKCRRMGAELRQIDPTIPMLQWTVAA